MPATHSSTPSRHSKNSVTAPRDSGSSKRPSSMWNTEYQGVLTTLAGSKAGNGCMAVFLSQWAAERLPEASTKSVTDTFPRYPMSYKGGITDGNLCAETRYHKTQFPESARGFEELASMAGFSVGVVDEKTAQRLLEEYPTSEVRGPPIRPAKPANRNV